MGKRIIIDSLGSIVLTLYDDFFRQIGEEKLLFADRVSALELRGKRNLFQSLKRVVSKKNVNKDVIIVIIIFHHI